MVLLCMWLILEIVDGLDENKKRAGATELYMCFLGRWPEPRKISSHLAAPDC